MADVNVLMVGDSKTAQMGTLNSRLDGGPYNVLEVPTRIATSGYTVALTKAYIDAQLAAATGTPALVGLNLGANEMGLGLPAEATWESDYGYILDAIHAKWPAARCYIMRPWRVGYTAAANIVAGWINTVLATRSAWALVGPDERVFLENGDNGATYLADGLHPTDAGYHLTGQQWRGVMGI